MSRGTRLNQTPWSAKVMTWRKTALAMVMAIVIFFFCFYVTTIILSLYSPLDAAIISF